MLKYSSLRPQIPTLELISLHEILGIVNSTNGNNDGLNNSNVGKLTKVEILSKVIISEKKVPLFSCMNRYSKLEDLYMLKTDAQDMFNLG